MASESFVIGASGTIAAIVVTGTLFVRRGSVVSVQRRTMTYVYRRQRGLCVRAELDLCACPVLAFTLPENSFEISSRAFPVRSWDEPEFAGCRLAF